MITLQDKQKSNAFKSSKGNTIRNSYQNLLFYRYSMPSSTITFWRDLNLNLTFSNWHFGLRLFDTLGSKIKDQTFFTDLALHDLWQFFFFACRRSGWARCLKKVWPFILDPYGSDNPSPKCQFENGTFKLRSLFAVLKQILKVDVNEIEPIVRSSGQVWTRPAFQPHIDPAQESPAFEVILLTIWFFTIV